MSPERQTPREEYENTQEEKIWQMGDYTPESTDERGRVRYESHDRLGALTDRLQGVHPDQIENRLLKLREEAHEQANELNKRYDELRQNLAAAIAALEKFERDALGIGRHLSPEEQEEFERKRKQNNASKGPGIVGPGKMAGMDRDIVGPGKIIGL